MTISTTGWLFGTASLGLILMAMVFLFWPILKRKTDTEQSRKAINVSLYESRVAELEQARSLDEIDNEEAELLKNEAAQHLLQDTAGDDHRQNGSQSRTWPLLLAGLLIPVFTIFVYLQGDGWRLLGAHDQSPPWDFIIQRAERRLAEDPEDIETWTFLARSQRSLEQYEEASRAYAEVNKLSEYSNPNLLVEEGESIAMIDEGNLRGRPTELFDLALSIDPKHGRALWYAGLAAVQRSDKQAAIGHWQTLSAEELPDSFRQVLERQLRKLGAEPLQPQKPAPVLNVSVDISEALRAGIPINTPVFVYARAVEGQGMPLAAKRITLGDLPAIVELDDSMRMAGGEALSSLTQWKITARVAKSGQAQSRAGDPIGETILQKNDALTGKPLLIDRLVQ